MSKEYALIAVNDNEVKKLYQSAAFDMNDVSEKIPLSEDKQLWISGHDDLQETNELLRQQLREAEESNIAKETFLSSMSHDIRTPMNAIIGMTTIAKKHIDEKSRVMDSLEKIEVASSHLLSLINEVLDMSRINSGKMVISSESFSLSDLLHEILTIVKPQATDKKHNLTVDISNIIYEGLVGDALRLRQIFLNIINNSIKYTNEGGNINISFREELKDDKVLLIFQCQDNGIGMSPEFLNKLFTPFERANTTTISKIEGTGLGMSIVKRLIDKMNGVIEVNSELGKGTDITISIPLSYENISINTAALKDRSLLIIEANHQEIEKYDRYLDEFGIKHEIVSSTTDAIAALTDAEFHNEHYDAVIFGKEFGNSNNMFDAAEYISKNHQLPIILISDHDFSSIEYRATRSGIVQFIPTPFFRKSLINGLNTAFEKTSEESHSATPDLSGKNILLVEDNTINRMIANEILKATNANIENAENGQEAVNMYLAKPENYYSIILMDIQMPVLDGYGATRQIRTSGRKDASVIAIYAMTANTFAEDIAKAREAGMDGHIAKPIDIKKLMQTLKNTVKLGKTV